MNLNYDSMTRQVDVYSLFEILSPRAEEIFDLLRDEILKYRLQHFMPSGMVLTGGGSLLSGMQDLARKKFAIPVRVGVPACYQNDDFNNYTVPDLVKSPIYATGYGLLLYASGHGNLDFASESSSSVLKKVFKRMKSWIYDFL